MRYLIAALSLLSLACTSASTLPAARSAGCRDLSAAGRAVRGVRFSRFRKGWGSRPRPCPTNSAAGDATGHPQGRPLAS
jgi:hypothetical protein